jgi:MFS family permease
MSGMTSPLAGPRFRLLWAGQTMSFLGDAVVPLALTLTILHATGSASDLGLLLAAAMVPRVLLMPVAGVWADWFRRERVMLAASVVSAAAQLTVGIELLAGTVHIGHLVLLSGLYGVAAAFLTPATTALVAGTVPATQLRQANALLEVSRQLARLAGPALATGILFGAGAGWVFVIDATTFAVAAVTLAALRVDRHSGQRETFRAELIGGWIELRRHRWLWTSLIAHAVWNLCVTSYQTVAPLVMIRILGSETGWVVVAQASAVGSVVGAFVALGVRPARPLIAVNAWLSTAALPLMAVAAGAPIAVIAVAAGIMHVGISVGNTLWCTAMQVHVPGAVLSRVAAYDWLASLGPASIGLAIMGPVAGYAGARLTLSVGALALAAACLGALAVPEIRWLTANGAERRADPRPAVDGTPAADDDRSTEVTRFDPDQLPMPDNTRRALQPRTPRLVTGSRLAEGPRRGTAR